MEYKPITAVWEITMNCNMRCKQNRCAKEAIRKRRVSVARMRGWQI